METKKAPLEAGEQLAATQRSFASLVEAMTPWLYEVGSWIFGGLAAFSVVIVAALITVQATDSAALISLTAFACALPLDVVGIFLLRLTKDMKNVAIDELALRAFRDADFPDIDAYVAAPQQRAAMQKRWSRAALLYSLGMALLSSLLTLTGSTAALWHVAWWIGVVLIVVVALSAVPLVAVMARSLPPESEAEKELRRRYAEYQGQKIEEEVRRRYADLGSQRTEEERRKWRAG